MDDDGPLDAMPTWSYASTSDDDDDGATTSPDERTNTRGNEQAMGRIPVARLFLWANDDATMESERSATANGIDGSNGTNGTDGNDGDDGDDATKAATRRRKRKRRIWVL